MKPCLYIIAGPNGSGKSTNAHAILPNGIECFDFDKIKWDKYKNIFDCELREEMSHHYAENQFELRKDNALRHKTNFAFETNFYSESTAGVIMEFKKCGFEILLYFIDLIHVDCSKERVKVRVQMGGHCVTESQIEERYTMSAINTNKYFDIFDYIMVLDSSFGAFRPVFEMESNKVSYKDETYISRWNRFPRLFN